MAQQALSKTRIEKDYKNTLNALQILTQTSRKKGNLSSAIVYMEQYDDTLHSLLKNERRVTERFSEIRYHVKEIEYLNAQLHQSIRHEKQVKWLWIAAFFILMLLIYFIYKKLKNQNTIKELEYQAFEVQKNTEIFELMLENETKYSEGITKERNRIGKELHDGIVNELYGIRLILESLNHQTDQENQKRRRKYIQKIVDVERQIYSMISNMERNSSLNTFQKMFLTLFEEKREMYPNLSIRENCSQFEWSTISNLIKLNIYRMIQETFQNTIKHAEASVFEVTVKRNQSVLFLQIIDNGKGFTPNMKKGNGLKNIRYRIKQLQGEININQNKEAKGTIYKITIPIIKK